MSKACLENVFHMKEGWVSANAFPVSHTSRSHFKAKQNFRTDDRNAVERLRSQTALHSVQPRVRCSRGQQSRRRVSPAGVSVAWHITVLHTSHHAACCPIRYQKFVCPCQPQIPTRPVHCILDGQVPCSHHGPWWHFRRHLLQSIQGFPHQCIWIRGVERPAQHGSWSRTSIFQSGSQLKWETFSYHILSASASTAKSATSPHLVCLLLNTVLIHNEERVCAWLAWFS